MKFKTIKEIEEYYRNKKMDATMKFRQECNHEWETYEHLHMTPWQSCKKWGNAK